MDSPDVVEQQPAGGGVNKPASGTYGEKTELANLQAALPQGEPPAPGPTVQPTPRPAGGGAGPTAPAGLPAGLSAPTQRPEVPVGTPLQAPAPTDPYAGAVDERQRRLRLLEMLSQHPQASPELREWADTVMRKLIARG